MSAEPTLNITPNARDKVMRVRDQEDDPTRLALWVSTDGISGGAFRHALRIAPLDQAGDDEVVQHHDDLPIVMPRDDVDKLQGATVTIEGDPKYGAIAVSNPNKPASPAMTDVPTGDLEGDVAQRVAHVLENAINPSIAQHGGRAELVGVEDDTAYLRLSGGCQGCGMAQVTLSQGIETSIRDAVPEIKNIVDVTDHASGEDPYFESAKK